MSSTSSPFALAVAPYAVSAKLAGPARETTTVTVTNQGTKPLEVTGSTLQLTAPGQATGICGAGPSWVSMTPQSFTLQPGAHQLVTVTLDVPATAHGTVSLAEVFRGTLAHASGVSVSGAVGSRITLSTPGTATSACVAAKAPARHDAAAPHAGAGTAGAGAVIMLALTAAFIVAVAHGWRRRRRNRRARQEVTS